VPVTVPAWCEIGAWTGLDAGLLGRVAGGNGATEAPSDRSNQRALERDLQPQCEGKIKGWLLRRLTLCNYSS
jgi:hypothetical protein